MVLSLKGNHSIYREGLKNLTNQAWEEETLIPYFVLLMAKTQLSGATHKEGEHITREKGR